MVGLLTGLPLMAKKSRALIYWEPFALSIEIYDDQGALSQEASTLIVEGKSTAQLFDEVTQGLHLKGVAETSLLIRQPSVKLTQFSTPQLSIKERREFLNAKIKREWDDLNDFYWSYVPLKQEKPSKESNQTFTIGKDFIDEFIRFSKSINALPLRAFTTQSLAIYSGVLNSNPKDKNIVLFDDENSIILVMISEGRPVLIREMPFSNFMEKAEEFKRLSKEIQRTWLYAKQQYKFFPNQMIFCGEDLYESKHILGELVDEVTLEKDTKQDWKQQLFQSSVIDPANLIPIKIQKVQRTLRLAQIFSISLLTLVTLAMMWSIYHRGILSGLNEKIKRENIKTEITEFQQAVKVKQAKKDTISQLHEQHQMVKEHTNSPIPAWLIMYLSENIPDNLVIKDLKVIRDSLPNVWQVKIYGMAPRDPIQSAELLKSFNDQTQSDFGRLNLKINWKVSWLKNIKTGLSQDPDDLIKPFRLEGTLFE